MNYRVNPEFKVEEFDNEILLYAVSNAKGIYLNETAYLVWKMCESGTSIEEIITFLEKEYPEQKNDIRKDVITAITSLAASDALLKDNA
jgi:hypothetical protein